MTSNTAAAAAKFVRKVFVYGTLKRGQPNYFRLQDPDKYGACNFLGEAKLCARYPMVITTKYNVPALLSKEGCGKVGSCIVIMCGGEGGLGGGGGVHYTWGCALH